MYLQVKNRKHIWYMNQITFIFERDFTTFCLFKFEGVVEIHIGVHIIEQGDEEERK